MQIAVDDHAHWYIDTTKSRDEMRRREWERWNVRLAQGASVDFDGESWLGYTPIRLPDTLTVRDRLPQGAAAVLINRNHTYTDLYLPIDADRERLLAAVDRERTIAEICPEGGDRSQTRAFFQQLWRWDQVVFNTSRE
jgi:hypothetical protein